MSDFVNPYAAPKVEEGPRELITSEDLVDAPLGRRFLNAIIDNVTCHLIATALGVGLVLIGLPAQEYVFLHMSSVLLTYVGYYLVCEWLFGFTVGKLITRTRVVNEDGGKPRFMQILGRSLARFVPLEPVSCFGNPPRGWHDKWSGTRVVLK